MAAPFHERPPFIQRAHCRFLLPLPSGRISAWIALRLSDHDALVRSWPEVTAVVEAAYIPSAAVAEEAG